ncbi:Os03g0632800 [Oryza sativa Japonica Group]|uniref:Os03g0632800 protein n=1 Tax=Oryza sativa subsp. japonica TaxID=39947 RepID=C7IZM4_ORYSJ|nr:Os03g0632800 [Oryza sativa Japonica Group]|eukprot:NP_001173552.1 Os03g0632800 [Oryza sativa Japonica Group]
MQPAPASPPKADGGEDEEEECSRAVVKEEPHHQQEEDDDDAAAAADGGEDEKEKVEEEEVEERGRRRRGRPGRKRGRRSGGGGGSAAAAAAARGGVVMVKRELLARCMTCPLCGRLLRDATTVSECLHTFCRKCIYEKLNDEEVESCPVCKIDLGCTPVEKLRDGNIPASSIQKYLMQKLGLPNEAEVRAISASHFFLDYYHV